MGLQGFIGRLWDINVDKGKENTIFKPCQYHNTVVMIIIITKSFFFFRCRHNTSKECETSLPYADNTYAYINRLDDLSISHQPTVSSETTIIACPESVYQSLEDVKSAQSLGKKESAEFEKVPAYNPEYHVLEG